MRYKRAKIDSLNLSAYNFENIFPDKEHYIIETIKGIDNFNPKEWLKTFGKPLTRNIVEAKIIYTNSGISIALKRFSVNPQKQTIEFAGLQGYNERSKFLKWVLRDKKSQLQDARITRVDVAIDYIGELPDHIQRRLKKVDRRLFKYGNTNYYKTHKERKVNPYINIKVYDKQHQAKLDFPCKRLEFSFRSGYFNGLCLKDMPKAIQKMEKSIKKMIGLNVKIDSI